MTTRAQLILAMARRARSPEDSAAVGRAVAEAGKTATADELDLLEAALATARETLEAYRSGRIRHIGKPRCQ